MRLKYKILDITFVLLVFLVQSCVSKKQVLYMQDINAIDISEVTSSEYTFQENDILKIDVTSLEMKASIPYNKVSPLNRM